MNNDDDDTIKETQPSLTSNHENIAATALGPLATTQTITAVADTRSTGHYFTVTTPLENLQRQQHPVKITLPDESTIKSTHVGEILIPQIPRQARVAYHFPDLGKDTSLLSIGQLCDHGCEAHFSQHEVVITHNNHIILRGYCNETTRGLWQLEISKPQLTLHAVNLSKT